MNDNLKQVKQKTNAYVHSLKYFDNINHYELDLRGHEIAGYDEYYVSIITHNKRLFTRHKKSTQDKIIIEWDKDIKSKKLKKVDVIVIPLSNTFYQEARLIFDLYETPLVDTAGTLLYKGTMLLHLILPVVMLLLLSASVKAFAIYFNTPLEFIDVIAQLNLLYALVLSILVDLFSFWTNGIIISMVVLVLMLMLLSFEVISGNFHVLSKAPYMYLQESFLNPKILKLILLGMYFIIVFDALGNVSKNVYRVLYNDDIKGSATVFLTKKDNMYFNTLNTYRLLSSFPKIITLENNQSIVVQGVKDNMVHYYRYEDYKESIFNEHNATTLKRLCNEDDSVAPFNLSVGLVLKRPQIGSTDILKGSTNIYREHKAFVEEYKLKHCKSAEIKSSLDLPKEMP